ncbi:ogr/Delta-like zinc finger family protein, partial [Escherichia coli]
CPFWCENLKETTCWVERTIQMANYRLISLALTQEVTERFYVCTDPGCGLVFKTLQTINRFIVRPVTPDELAERLHEKQELPPVRLKTQSYSLRLE